MAKFCIYCGGELQEVDVYCGKCGRLVEGKSPPPNAWSAAGPAASAPPPKKKGRGCLTILLILLLVAALGAAAFFYLRGRIFSSKPGETEPPAATASAGGISIGWDDLLKPSESKEPAPTPAATPEATPEPAVETPAFVNPFDDVSEDKYYYDAVMWAYQKGLTGGTSFLPAQDCTRAQAVTMMWRAAGSPESASITQLYTDVESKDYYYQACMWANNVGITNATPGGQFYPDMAITRAQMATFLYRLVGYKVTSANPFTDVKESDYFYDAVLWALDAGVIGGGTDTFRPNDVCDRGNAVTFLYRAMKDIA